MSRQKLEFEAGDGVAKVSTPDNTSTEKQKWNNTVIKAEFQKFRKKLQDGANWLRFMPAVRGTSYGWMFPMLQYQLGNNTFLSPKTLGENNQDPIVAASIFFRKNHPEILANRKTNPNGFVLRSRQVSLSWVIDPNAEEGKRLGLFSASMYDGSWGGSTGLAHDLYKEATAVDLEPGSSSHGEPIYGDITAPDTGRLVNITRTSGGGEYPSYTVSIGKKQSPLDAMIDLLTDEEVNAIVPLEKTINIESEQAINGYLAEYLGDWYGKLGK